MDKSEIQKKLEEMSQTAIQDDKKYLDELKSLVKNECWRSSIVLGWNMFMHNLYLKVEEYGLEAFADKAESKNRDVNYLNRATDLNDMKDSEVLLTSKELGILPNQLEDQLRTIQLRKRNNCAHFGSHAPSENSVYEFFSEIFDALDELEDQEFETRETEFLEAIKNMSAEEIGNLPVTGKKVRNGVSQMKEELLFIESEPDYENHANYMTYLRHITSETDDEEIIEDILKLALEIVHSRVYGGLTKDADKLLSMVLKRKRSKKLVNSNTKMKNRLITGFADSGSYRQAERRMRWILKIEKTLDGDDWNRIAQATAQNRQIYEASKCRNVLPDTFESYSENISQGTLEDLESRSSHWENISY